MGRTQRERESMNVKERLESLRSGIKDLENRVAILRKHENEDWKARMHEETIRVMRTEEMMLEQRIEAGVE